jgi:hypothetical protein
VRAQPEDGQATSKKQSRPVTPCLPLLPRDEPAGGQARRPVRPTEARALPRPARIDPAYHDGRGDD